MATSSATYPLTSPTDDRAASPYAPVEVLTTVAGLVLILMAAVLLLLPLKSWQGNLRGRATPRPA